MFIKEIILDGFKSYRRRTVIRLHRKHNAIVGRNGSGKSNVFKAIEFVLSEKYRTLRGEQRTDFIHDNARGSVVSAYVELIFDNREGRLMPQRKRQRAARSGRGGSGGSSSDESEDSDEVRIRRVIDRSKDEFYVDGKLVTKSELQSLLESAGLPRSCSHFIVAQGSIAQRTKESDSERLRLVKEIAGTRIYDDRRKESVRILDSARHKHGQIDEILANMEQKSELLEGDVAELKEFDKLDIRRKVSEYLLYTRQLRIEKENRDRLIREESRQRDNHSAMDVDAAGEDVSMDSSEGGTVQGAEEDRHETLASIVRKKAELETLLSTNQERRVELERVLQPFFIQNEKLTKQKSRLESEMTQDRARLQEFEKQRRKLERELSKVNSDIDKAEEELAELQPELQEQMAEQNTLKNRLDSSTARLKNLESVSLSRGQFQNKSQRNDYLNQELEKVSEVIEDCKHKMDQLSGDIEATNKQLSQDHLKLSELKSGKEKELSDRLSAMEDSYEEHKQQWQQCRNETKRLWNAKKESELAKSKSSEKLRTKKEEFRRTMSLRMYESYVDCKRAIQRHGLDDGNEGVIYGPIIELIRARHPGFHTAIEEVAKNRLFHWVVDSEDTAVRIIEKLQKDRCGRVTFIPLDVVSERMKSRMDNRRPDQISVDEKIDNDSSVRRLIDCVECVDPSQSEILRPALQQMFGDSLLVENLRVGHQKNAAYLGYNCVTPSGDRISARCEYEGGYPLGKSGGISRLGCISDILRLKNELSELDEKLEQIKQDTLKSESDQREWHEKMQNVEIERDQCKQELSHLRGVVITELSTRISNNSSLLNRRQQFLSEITVRFQSQNDRANELRSKLDSEFTQSDSDGEESKELEELHRQIEEERLAYEECSKECDRLSGQIDSISKHKLKKNLYQSRQRIQDLISGFNGSIESCQRSIEIDKNHRLDEIEFELQSLLSGKRENETELAEVNDLLSDTEKRMESLLKREMEVTQEIAEMSAAAQKRSSEKGAVLGRIHQLEKRIRELGSIQRMIEHSGGTDMSGDVDMMGDQSDDDENERREGGHTESQRRTAKKFYDKWKEKSDQSVRKKLTSIMNKIKDDFPTVNRKAFEQFRGLRDQKEALRNRHDRTAEDRTHIDTLMGYLDSKKVRAIQSTFDTINEEFVKMFKLLVPRGKASLTMIFDESSNNSNGNGDSDESSEESPMDSQRNEDEKEGDQAQPIGVSISASFTGGEAGLTQSLSGGQKSVVALAIIFAIQRCDPAPFYVFDEIDAALDTQYRTGIANMIDSMANDEDHPSQFITTTFRPELLEHAHQYHCVEFKHNVSIIKTVDRSTAKSVIASEN